MVLARYYAENGYWMEAAEVWADVAENDNSKYFRRRSAFNMVIACEILNRRDLAKGWAEEILCKYENSLSGTRAHNYLTNIRLNDNTLACQFPYLY